MLRRFPTVQILSLTSECCPPINHQQLQLVRWARKPIWMGTAKSKLFRIPVKPKIPEIEAEELKRLFNIYRTQVKSIKNFLVSKHSLQLMAKADTEQLKRDFEEDFARCSEINDKWNEELRKIREVRLQEELERDMEFARNRLQILLSEASAKEEEAEKIVLEVKELSANFITPDNVDEAIEYALNNPVDFNFAIDLEGNRIEGSETYKKSEASVTK